MRRLRAVKDVCADARRRRAVTRILVLPALLAAGCATVRHERPSPSSRPVEVGTASWYGSEFQGSRTASGERFDPREYTAASRSLPIGTRVRVTNLANRRSTIVRINDRGPYVRGRVLDVSHAAARALDMVGRGTARVSIARVDERESVATRRIRRKPSRRR